MMHAMRGCDGTWRGRALGVGLVFVIVAAGSIGALLVPPRAAHAEEAAEVPPSLEAFSRTFREVAKKAQPAVVQVIARAIPKAAETKDESLDTQELPDALREFFERRWPGPDRELPDELREFFKRPGPGPDRERGAPRFGTPRPRLRAGIGSGVIIDAAKGYIITNNHVVEMADTENSRIDVQLYDGRVVPAKIMGRDPKTDLAMIQISTKVEDLQDLPLGTSEEMQVGDWVLAIGAPFNLPQTVTQGIISATGRNPGIVLGYEDLIQTDAAINPGNSGGPLLNLKGEIIGINTAIATTGLVAGYMGIGFAVPSETVRELLPAFERGEEVVRGYLGVRIRSLEDFEPGIGKTFGLEKDEGILIEGMKPGSPADRAGLQVDDVILAYDGKKVTSITQLQRWVAYTAVGTKVDVTVWRDGKEIVVPVEIDKQPEDFFASGGWEGRPGQQNPFESEEPVEVKIEALGMTVAQLTPELAKQFGWDRRGETDGRVVVIDVEPLGDAAAVLGIRPGDLILQAGGEAIDTPAALRKALNEEALAEGVRMRIRDARTGQSRTLYTRVSD